MKHFDKTNRFFNKLYRWCVNPRHLFFITLISLSIPNVALAFTEKITCTGRVANVLAPMGAVWLMMTVSRRPGKTVWTMFPLIFFAAFQIVLLYLFGRSVIAVDMFLNLVTTNPGEAMELLDNLEPAVSTVVIIYIPVLALGVCSLKRHDMLDRAFISAQRKAACALLAVGCVFVGASYAADDDYRVENDIYPVNVGYNLCLAVERSYATAHYEDTSRGFTFKAVPSHPSDSAEIYVLVIGETARAMNFGIYGYGRQTTPLLDRTDGLTVFKDVVTQSNTTHKSVPMILSAASAEDYDRIYREKSIITAFHEAGFHTAFYSNQKPNHSFIDIFGKEADEWEFIKEEASGDENIYDEELVRLLKEKLSEDHKKLFVVLHTYGSHFNYRERYPRSEAFFGPDDATEAVAVNRKQLINAYDNTIRQTDRLLHDITVLINRPSTAAAMIYTSDHGENIFDDGRKLFLHASPVPSYYDMHVPLLVWTSPTYRHTYPGCAAALINNSQKSTTNSASVFHTMLTMAGIDTPLLNDSLSLASGKYTPAARHYLNDHNKPKRLDRIGLDPEDEVMFKKRGMTFP